MSHVQTITKNTKYIGRSVDICFLSTMHGTSYQVCLPPEETDLDKLIKDSDAAIADYVSFLARSNMK